MRESFVVVDASVALKWAFNDEEHVAEAIALRDDWVQRSEHRLLAPSLFYYEVTNGLCTAVRRGRLEAEIGSQLLQHLLDIGIRFVDPGAEDIYLLAIRYSIAAYDAAYLALSEAIDCPVWTGDRRFYQAVRNQTTRVRWIGHYSHQ